MNSKEALENIKNILSEDGFTWDYIEDIEQIEKDLEILQILKNYMIIFNKNEIRIYLYGKEMKKFKEWLENE